MRQRAMTVRQVQRAISRLSSLVEAHNEVVPDDWDEPLWSLRRLWGAWRMWVMYQRLGTCHATLRDILTYYRRHEADWHDHTQKDGTHATIF